MSRRVTRRRSSGNAPRSQPPCSAETSSTGSQPPPLKRRRSRRNGGAKATSGAADDNTGDEGSGTEASTVPCAIVGVGDGDSHGAATTTNGADKEDEGGSKKKGPKQRKGKGKGGNKPPSKRQQRSTLSKEMLSRVRAAEAAGKGNDGRAAGVRTVDIASASTTIDDVATLLLEVGRDCGVPPLHHLPRSLGRALKPHQLEGIRFVWKHVRRADGCVLADYMGLGKTLQVLCVCWAFVNAWDPGTATLKGLAPDERGRGSGAAASSGDAHGESDGGGSASDNDSDNDDEDSSAAGNGTSRDMKGGDSIPSAGGARSGRVLVVAPAIVVRNWFNEARLHFPSHLLASLNLVVVDSTLYKSVEGRVQALQRWHQRGGVALIGYELFRGLIEPGRAQVSDAQRQQLRAVLCEPGPDMIVLDEGHRLRDNKSLLFRAFSRVATTRRVVLTGYPLQNHLVEYYCMVNFCRPGVLGTKAQFKDRFQYIITAGSAKDSLPQQVVQAKRRTYVLSCLLRPYVLRRGVAYLKAVLPAKKEWVVYCQLSTFQARLYVLACVRGCVWLELGV